MNTQDNSRENYPTFSRAVGRLIDKLTDVWFDEESEDITDGVRRLCAFAGSATCFIFATGVYDNLWQFMIAPDAKLKVVYVFLVIPIFFVLSVFFAFLVTYKGRKSGPVRSYLAAFLLPAFIMWTLNRVIFL